jgi:hypothetical protein
MRDSSGCLPTLKNPSTPCSSNGFIQSIWAAKLSTSSPNQTRPALSYFLFLTNLNGLKISSKKVGEDNEEEEEKEADEEGTPPPAQISKGKSFAALLTSAAPSKSLVRRCDSLKLTKVKPGRLARLLSSREHSYSIRELPFTLFVKKWNCRFSKHILLCRPVDFIYREVFFAILSLASGEFKLLADQTPLNDRGQHTPDRLGRPNGPSVLPDFGSGVHVSNILPGSAPDRSIYWFKGILIMLADELVRDDGHKGAIAKVIEFGQVSGSKTFDALITNIQTFTLVRVTDNVVVQHTELIKLVTYTALSGSESESSDGSEAYEEFVSVRGDTDGFDILMNFFRCCCRIHSEAVQTYRDGPSERAV